MKPAVTIGSSADQRTSKGLSTTPCRPAREPGRALSRSGLTLAGLVCAVAALDSQPADAASFAERCQAAGVTLCVGFDSASDIDPYTKASADGNRIPKLDTSTKASGNGSLKLTVPGNTTANTAGHWRRRLGGSFGPGDTFYVQYRQRFSPEMMNNMSGDGWKQSILHYYEKTCENIQLVMQNGIYRNLPQPYSECGGVRFRQYYGPNNSDYYIQWGSNYQNPSPSDVLCDYKDFKNGNTSKCLLYKPNQWMTFYTRVTLGSWGQPQSTVQIWMGEEGQPLKMVVDRKNHTFRQNQNRPNSVFDAITLLAWITGKNASTNHPTAYTWYDELVVSTKPIAGPTGIASPGDSVAPMPPTNVQVSALTN